MLRYVTILLLIWSAESAKILGIFPSPDPDHFAIGSRLMGKLAENGFEVVFVTVPGMEVRPNNNFSYVYIENLREVGKRFNSTFADRMQMGFIHSTTNYFNNAYDVTEALLTDINLQSMLQHPQKFDVIVADYSGNEAILGVAKILKSPIVLISSLPSSSLMNELFANPAPNAYVPNIFTEHTGDMSYFERIDNVVCNTFLEYYRHLLALPRQETLLNKYVDSRLGINNVVESASLILLNSHPSVTEPVPHTPNMIEVGGLHITSPKKLPTDVENFVNAAEYGVIYLTMDPNLGVGNLGSAKLEAFLNTFKRLKQRVLWNLDEKLVHGIKNLKIIENIPHQDIIGHPKIKLLITDGNLLRIMEAVHFGVPIIGIPILAEQRSNMARVAYGRYGINIKFNDLTEKELFQSIEDIFEKFEYTVNVLARSKVMNDRLASPLDVAVYWVSYVVRHGGANYYQSPGVRLPLFKRRLIDIVLMLTLLDIILFLIFYYIFKHIFKKSKQRKSKSYDHLKEDSE